MKSHRQSVRTKVLSLNSQAPRHPLTFSSTFPHHRTVLSRRIPRFPHYEYSRRNYGIRGILVDWQSSFRSKRPAYLWSGYVNNRRAGVFRTICSLVVPLWLMKQPGSRGPIISRVTCSACYNRRRYRTTYAKRVIFFVGAWQISRDTVITLLAEKIAQCYL